MIQDCLLSQGATTREYVHLVTRVHFRSPVGGGVRVKRFDKPYLKPRAARKQHGSMFDGTAVTVDRSFTLQE